MKVIQINLRKWNKLWKDNQQQVGKSWKKYASNDEIDNTDYSNFIKNLFANIPFKFYRNRHDARDFFRQAEAVKRINRFAKYYYDEEGKDTDVDFNIKSSKKLSRNDVFKIFEFYLQDDGNLIIRSEKEQQLIKAKGGLKQSKI